MLIKVRKRARPLRWYVIWYLIFFFAIAAIISVSLTLPVWKIKNVKIIGTEILSSKVVEDVASIPIGEHIFIADLSENITRLKSITQIKDFGIYRRLPNTLIIKIIERKPLAVVPMGKESMIIDEEGVILKRTSSKGIGRVKINVNIGDISVFPVVRGIKRDWISGNRLNPKLALSIGKALTKLGCFLKPSSLQLDMENPDDISLLIEDILRVKLGNTRELSSKIETLEALLPQVEGKWNEVEYIDIRYTRTPVIRFRD